jgi:hypothetical protein
MTTAPAKKARQMPKGGRKGSAMFPRIPLSEAVEYAKRLVSKTHIGPQTRDVVLMGVIGSKHDKGIYGMSALKQYGLMTGDNESKFSADDLAKKIAAAPLDELAPLYRQAALRPTVFKGLFETYHGDSVSKAKLKQRAADLKVHPDETGNCVDLYVATMVTAGLVTVAGEQITHLASGDTDVPPVVREEEGAKLDDQVEEPASEDSAGGESDYDGTLAQATKGSNGSAKPSGGGQRHGISGAGPRAVFNVNVTLDASLDVEKLEKQLALLRRFGAL